MRAEGEVEAEKLRAEGEVELSRLKRRATARVLNEAIADQTRLEAAVKEAIHNVKENAHPEEIDEDFLTRWMNEVKAVTDPQMRTIWAKILAGESNSPGSYSKRTLGFLSTMSKKEAELFTTLCSFAFGPNCEMPLILAYQDAIYADQGLTHGTLSDLDSIGLIQFNPDWFYYSQNINTQSWTQSYYGETFSIYYEKYSGEPFRVSKGHVLLSPIGQELARIAGGSPILGFIEYIAERLPPNLRICSPFPSPSTWISGIDS